MQGNSTLLKHSAARGNEAERDLQYKQDTVICRLVRTPLCWTQATERYGACLAGNVLIAAQAQRAGTTLVTANTREFARVPGLVVVDWAA
jgi:predicted nucleic acid-binding protein